MIHPSIAERIATVAADRVHGASFLAREALGVLAAAAAESRAESVVALQAELHAAAAALIAARPDMAPVRNLVTLLVQQIRHASAPDVATFRQHVIAEAERLRHQSEEAVARIAEQAAVLLPVGATIATASFSQTVVVALMAAQRAGKRPRVMAAESLVAGIAYGERLVVALAPAGIPATVVPDRVLSSMGTAILGLIGADTVLADGGIVNGTPSRLLAETLHDAGVPLFVLCETAKIDRSRRSEPEPEVAPGFDLVPPTLITSIVTESGKTVATRSSERSERARDEKVLVRPMALADAQAFLALVDALADYERLPRPAPAARDRLVRDALADSPRFCVLLAERSGRIVGYAAYFETYSTFLALPTLYLEDIFVLPEERHRGVGLTLFRACVQEAVRRGCGRMEWQVLTWNEPALSFYEKLGAVRLEDWRSYRLDAEALRRTGSS